MIEGLIGRPGSGKSYQLTAKAIAEAKRGRMVFANYAINHPNCYTFDATQLLDLPPGVIVIDEAHLWFPARKSLNLPSSWLAMLSQTRKNGWDLYWAAQHESRVDRIVRDVSSWMWLCSSWWWVNGHPLYFESKQYEPEVFRKHKAHSGRKVQLFNQKIADSYDTYQRLEVAEHAQDKGDLYAAASAGTRARAGGGAR